MLTIKQTAGVRTESVSSKLKIGNTTGRNDYYNGWGE